MPKEEANVSLTPADLTNLVAAAVKAAVEEAKKPYVSDEDKRRLEQDQIDRKQQAALIAQMEMNKKVAQKRCLHEARDGHTHTVFITDEQGGYILCQKCQVVVRPGNAPNDYKGTAVFNTDLFNNLFQRSSTSGVWD